MNTAWHLSNARCPCAGETGAASTGDAVPGDRVSQDVEMAMEDSGNAPNGLGGGVSLAVLAAQAGAAAAARPGN